MEYFRTDFLCVISIHIHGGKIYRFDEEQPPVFRTLKKTSVILDFTGLNFENGCSKCNFRYVFKKKAQYFR